MKRASTIVGRVAVLALTRRLCCARRRWAERRTSTERARSSSPSTSICAVWGFVVPRLLRRGQDRPSPAWKGKIDAGAGESRPAQPRDQLFDGPSTPGAT